MTGQRVVIVGGGVLGTMHAVMARRRGFDVVHLEREPEARGASVRRCSARRPGCRTPGSGSSSCSTRPASAR